MKQQLQQQWDATIAWLREVDAESRVDIPSGVGAWTVGDLIAHLGYGIAMINEIEPAKPGTAPISVGRYIAGYEAAREVIADQSHILRQQLGTYPIQGIDVLAEEAWRSLTGLCDGVVIGRRGPLTLRDYLMTRLIEVVVHSDDLARALGRDSSEFAVDAAVQAVSDTLSAAYFERWGVRPITTDRGEWIRVATGRQAGQGPPLLC